MTRVPFTVGSGKAANLSANFPSSKRRKDGNSGRRRWQGRLMRHGRVFGSSRRWNMQGWTSGWHP